MGFAAMSGGIVIILPRPSGAVCLRAHLFGLPHLCEEAAGTCHLGSLSHNGAHAAPLKSNFENMWLIFRSTDIQLTGTRRAIAFIRSVDLLWVGKIPLQSSLSTSFMSTKNLVPGMLDAENALKI